MALQLDGSTQYVNLGGPRPYARNVSAAALSIWGNRADVAVGTTKAIFGCAQGDQLTTTRIRIELDIPGPTLRIRARALDSDASSILNSNTAFPIGVWTHMACVVFFTTRIGIFYVNGVQVAAGSLTNMTAGNTSNTDSLMGTIGAAFDGAGTEFSAATFADARIYNRFLGPTEIQTIYAATGRDDIVSGLMGRWMLNEGALNAQSLNIPDLSSRAFGGITRSSISGIRPLYVSDILSPRRRKQRR